MLLRQCDPDLLVMFVWLIPMHCGYNNTSMLCKCYSVLYITFHTRHIPVTLAGSNPVTLWFCMKVTVSVATTCTVQGCRCFFFSLQDTVRRSSRFTSTPIKIPVTIEISVISDPDLNWIPTGIPQLSRSRSIFWIPTTQVPEHSLNVKIPARNIFN